MLLERKKNFNFDIEKKLAGQSRLIPNKSIQKFNTAN